MSRAAFSLTPVSSKDAHALWLLANAPEVRQASLHPEPFCFDSHKEWLTRYFGHKSHLLWLCWEKEQLVGYVRFDEVDPNVSEISFAVSPQHWGRGIATFAIREGLLKLRKTTRFKKVIGKVLTTNEASCKLFAKLGFRTVPTNTPNLFQFEKQL